MSAPPDPAAFWRLQERLLIALGVLAVVLTLAAATRWPPWGGLAGAGVSMAVFTVFRRWQDRRAETRGLACSFLGRTARAERRGPELVDLHIFAAAPLRALSWRLFNTICVWLAAELAAGRMTPGTRVRMSSWVLKPPTARSMGFTEIALPPERARTLRRMVLVVELILLARGFWRRSRRNRWRHYRTRPVRCYEARAAALARRARLARLARRVQGGGTTEPPGAAADSGGCSC